MIEVEKEYGWLVYVERDSSFVGADYFSMDLAKAEARRDALESHLQGYGDEAVVKMVAVRVS